MVIKNRALRACQARIHTVFTVLLKSVRFFIIDVLSCKASSEEKELAKLSCLNDSETQERGLWEVKIEENFPLGHAPGPPPKAFQTINGQLRRALCSGKPPLTRKVGALHDTKLQNV